MKKKKHTKQNPCLQENQSPPSLESQLQEGMDFLGAVSPVSLSVTGKQKVIKYLSAKEPTNKHGDS